MDLIKEEYLTYTGEGESWQLRLSAPKNKIRSYYEEIVSTAEYIYANKEGKLHVLYSGGLDSEYICRVFLAMGIDFVPVIIRLNGPGIIYNQHDIQYAIDFCSTRNLSPCMYDIDYDQFVESGKYLTMIKDVGFPGIMTTVVLDTTLYLNGTSIIGMDPPYIKYDQSTDTWVFEEPEFAYASLRFYAKHNLHGTPFMLMHSAEVTLSFLLDPNIVKLGTNNSPGKTGSNSTKSKVYNNGSGFNMDEYNYDNRTRTKYTGTEVIYKSKIWDHENLQLMREYRDQCSGVYQEDYSALVDRLSIHQ